MKIESEHAGQMNFQTEGKIKNLWSFQPLPVAEGNKATQRGFFFFGGVDFFFRLFVFDETNPAAIFLLLESTPYSRFSLTP